MPPKHEWSLETGVSLTPSWSVDLEDLKEQLKICGWAKSTFHFDTYMLVCVSKNFNKMYQIHFTVCFDHIIHFNISSLITVKTASHC